MSVKVIKPSLMDESENKFRSLFENSPTGIALIDTEGNVLEVNTEILSLLGSPSVEATKGVNVLKFEPLIKVGFTEDFKKCLSTGKNVSRLAFYVTKLKKGIFVQYSLSSFLEGNGKVSGVILNVIDITAQKEAEEKEKKHFSDLEFITKSATEMLELPINIDPLFFIGERLKSILGDNTVIINKFNSETKTSSTEYVFLKEERKKEFNKILNRNIERLKFDKTPPPVHNFNFKKKLVELNPVDFFIDACFFPEKESKKIIELHKINKVYFMGICPENNLLASLILITYFDEIVENKEVIETFINQTSLVLQRQIALKDLSEAKEKIEESEEKFRTIFETANDGILVADAETKKFIFANPQICSITGYNLEEITNISVADFHPLEELENVLDKFEKQLRGEIGVAENLPVVKKNGEIVYCDINSSSMEIGGKNYLLGFFRDITNRKVAEQELLLSKNKIEESEKKFRELYEKSGDAVLIIRNSMFVDCNQATVDMLKYKSKQEFLDCHPSTVSPPFQPDGMNSIEKAEKMMKAAFEKGTHRFEWDHMKKDGEVFPVEVLLTAISNKENNKVIYTVWRDITERKKSEQELIRTKEKAEESEKKFRELYEKSGDAILMLNNSLFSDCNKATVDLFKYKNKDEIIKLHPSELSPEFQSDGMSSFEKAEMMINQALKNGTNRFIWDHKRSNGDVFPAEVLLTAISNENNLQVIHAVVRDITDRKNAEIELLKSKEKIEESENRLRFISSITSDYIFQLDVDQDGKTKMTFISENFNFVTGRTIDEVETPAKWVKVIHPDDLPELTRLLTLVISTGNAVEMECRSFINNNEIRWVSVSAKAKIDEKTNKVIAVVGSVKDITERKKAEEQIIKALKKAEESDKLKSAFLANMSHELRTPINGIIGFSNLLLKPDNTLEKKEKFVSQINASTSMLLRLIEDIIDIAKIESGSLTIEKSPCRPSDIIKELFVHYQQELKARNKENIKLKYNQHTDLSLTIVTDPFRLRQVLLNLLSNAVKFTTTGTIEYGFSVEINEILFYVKDTGIGIKQEYQQQIFERFAQLELSLSRKFGGTGLGLTISKNIIEHLGGTIWVESEWEKGSTFFFKIPAEIISATEYIVENVIFNPNQYQWGKFTILVAEDDDLNFMFIEEMLADTKIKLVRAKNGLEAIEIVKKNSDISMVLMDIQMPFMDGYQSTREILLLKPHLPIIAQTAFALASEKEMSFKAGCIDYISKPIDVEELHIKIKKFLPVKL